MGKMTLGGMQNFETAEEFAVYLRSKGWTSGLFRKFWRAGLIYGLYPEEVDEICAELSKMEAEHPTECAGPTREEVMAKWEEKLRRWGIEPQ